MIEFAFMTYERAGMLEKTVDSYLKSHIQPERITVFDDHSDSGSWEKMEPILSRLPGVKIVRNTSRIGHAAAQAHAIKQVFDSTDADAVMEIDSDTLFNRNWYTVLLDAHESLFKQPDYAGITLYNNTFFHPPIGEAAEGIVRKASTGGFGWCIPRIFFKEVIETTKWDYPSSWDNNIIPKIYPKWHLYATEMSYLQHIGRPDIPQAQAINFIGE